MVRSRIYPLSSGVYQMISDLQQDSFISEINLMYRCDICQCTCSREILEEQIIFRCFKCGKLYKYTRFGFGLK